jgi:hypothetical protein
LRKLLIAAVLCVSAACAVTTQRLDSLAMITRMEAFGDRELPGAVPGESHAEWFTPLAQVVADKGYTVVLALGMTERNLMGLTAHDMKLVLVNADLDGNERVNTLAHEIGHLMEPEGMEWPISDVYAEAVAFVVCGKLGLDTGFASLRYLQPRRQFAQDTIARYSKRIDAVAAEIVTAAQAHR